MLCNDYIKPIAKRTPVVCAAGTLLGLLGAVPGPMDSNSENSSSSRDIPTVEATGTWKSSSTWTLDTVNPLELIGAPDVVQMRGEVNRRHDNTRMTRLRKLIL